MLDLSVIISLFCSAISVLEPGIDTALCNRGFIITITAVKININSKYIKIMTIINFFKKTLKDKNFIDSMYYYKYKYINSKCRFNVFKKKRNIKCNKVLIIK